MISALSRRLPGRLYLPRRQQQAQNNKAEFERSLSYTAEVGAVFKEKVEITEHCMQAVPRG
jgi:hypothetical protein